MPRMQRITVAALLLALVSPSPASAQRGSATNTADGRWQQAASQLTSILPP